jgi:hypothetical protein
LPEHTLALAINGGLEKMANSVVFGILESSSHLGVASCSRCISLTLLCLVLWCMHHLYEPWHTLGEPPATPPGHTKNISPEIHLKFGTPEESGATPPGHPKNISPEIHLKFIKFQVSENISFLLCFTMKNQISGETHLKVT